MRATPPRLPEWVYKRDGRVVPFDADKISAALFAAGESLGAADAFTARELTDGILHFLSGEIDETIPTTVHLAEMVVKVVRELGQPALAQAYADGVRQKTAVAKVGPSRAPIPAKAISADELCAVPHSRALWMRVGAEAVDEWTLRHVFSRDIAAAHHQGLMTIGNRAAPLELAAVVMTPPFDRRTFEAIESTRGMAGSVVVIDGAEHYLQQSVPPVSAADFARELGMGLRATGLRAVVNVNCNQRPSWAGELAEGPLFATQRQSTARRPPVSVNEDLLESLLGDTVDRAIRVAWHLSQRDFESANRAPLARLVRRALDGAALAFAIDRPKKAVVLGEGIDRTHPAVLMNVALHLGRLVEPVGLPAASVEQARQPAWFFKKLGSLARMALSAGLQKRNFLRRLERRWPAFLLERARLVVAPLQLETVVESLTGQAIESSGAGLDFAGELLQHLAQVLRDDGQRVHLDATIDAKRIGSLPRINNLKDRLGAAGALVVSGGLRAPELEISEAISVDEAVDLLQWTWRHSPVAWLQFVRAPARQLTAFRS